MINIQLFGILDLFSFRIHTRKNSLETVKKNLQKSTKVKNSFVINLDLKMSVDASSLSNNFTSLVRRKREGNKEVKKEGKKKRGLEGGKHAWREGC